MAVRLILLLALVACASAACPTVQYATGTRFSASSFTANQNIVIPTGSTYLFDLASSPTYGNIYVDGTLVFADEKDVELNARYLLVRPGGKLIIGSCDCPFAYKATLTFWGTDKTLNPDGYGTKGLAVGSRGTALLFGQIFGPSWTTLASSVNVGATQMVLSETVSWKVGDTLVIASTDYDQNQAEVVNITQIVNPTTINFVPALKFGHHAGTYNGLEERAEVARLNRNIVIRGDAGSDATRFGAHTMFAFDFTEVRLSGVEVTRAGQAGVLARYPIHFHFANDTATRAFIKDCSSHDNYQRCYTIHHTDSLLIQRNIGYNTRGHCYFLEDGIEQNNKFLWNLGLVTKQPFSATERLIPTDTDPVVFWVTNPNNTFVANVAAGGVSHCWWIALPVNPMGPSATPTMCPRRTPLQYFAWNKAHSCGQDCLHNDRGPDANGVPGGSDVLYNWPDANGNNRWTQVGAGYNPVANPADLTTNVRVEAKFNNFHAYRCQGHGVWTRNGLVTFYQPIFADNSIGITFATNGGYGMLQDGTFIGQTANKGNPSQWELQNNKTGVDGRTLPSYGDQDYPIRGYEFYDGPNTAANVRCFNFKNDALRQASCISMLRRDEFQISSTNEAYDVLITDGSVPVNFPDWLHDGDRQSVFIDQDGSVTGRPPVGNQKAVVTNRAQFLKLQSCIDTSATTGTMICPNQYGRLGWDWPQASDPSSWPDAATVATLDGLAKLSRSDQSASIYMPVCGGACNSPPNTDGKTLSVPRRGFQMTLPLAPPLPATRDVMLTFNHPLPRKLNMRLTYTNAFYDANAGIRNEVTVAVCVGSSTRFDTSVSSSYGYNNQNPVTNAATSLAALRTNPILTSYPTRGNGMWFLDTSTGYLYVRFVPMDNRTAANMRDAYPAIEASFNFDSATIPAGNPVCPQLTGGSSADRGLPPIATVAAPPAFGTPADSVPRDDTGNLCSATAAPAPSVAIATVATGATVDSTAATTNAATTAAASATLLSTVTTSEASVSLSTTAQSTTSISFAASTTNSVTSTTAALSTSTRSVSTSNAATSTAAAAAATTSVSASTTGAAVTASTTNAASTTIQATSLSAVADSTAASSLTGTTTSASTTAATVAAGTTAAETTSVAASLNAVSATNSGTTTAAANSVSVTAAAESTSNAASATSVVSSTFAAATNAASTTTTVAATAAVSTTSLATLTASTTAVETTTTAAAATGTGTGGAPQTFTFQLNWCPSDTAAFSQQLVQGLAAYASVFLGRTVSPSEFTMTVSCPTNGPATATVVYSGGDSAVVGVLVNAANDGSLQQDPNFTGSCSGTCATNVASASMGKPSGGGKKGVPVWVWVVVAIVVLLVVVALIGLAVFFYLKTQKGGGVRTSTRAPLRPMYNLDEMYGASAGKGDI